ncbi:MAG: Gfo/Idh/MocA family protein [Thermodesulfobacteriota bacterium]
MTQNINIGLAGCGRIASLVYLNMLNKIPGLKLIAIAESDSAIREKAGKSALDVTIYPDYNDLLGDPDINAVIICLPNHLHAQAAIAAFNNGKHVYLEKPIAVKRTEAEGVITVWKESNLVGMTGFNLRFNPLYRALKEHVKTGIIGDVTCVRTVFTSPGRALPEWKKRRSTGGGALLDLASHHVDLIQYILGNDVIEIYARVRSHTTEDDNVVLEYKTSGNIDIQSYFSINSADEDKIEVYGTLGKLTADRYNSLNVEIDTSDSAEMGRIRRLTRGIRSMLLSPNLIDKILATGREPSFELAISHFVSAMRGLQKASPDLLDGYKCLAVLEAAEESARTGRVIALQEC